MQPWLRILVACLTILIAQEALGQVERVLPRRTKATLEGTEFLVAFMENEVKVSTAPVVLRIFIASEFKANVVVEYPDGSRLRYTIMPDDVQTVDVLAQWMSTNSELIERKSIRVTSDVPIVVYTMNSRVKSTDTYTAIPVKHFGTEYMVVTRGVDRYRIDRTRPDPTIDTSSRQGEFLIVANHDNTTVTYTTTARTERGLFPGIPYTVNLDKGETFLVKGAKGPSGDHDLTGSRIVADKPIGVFSGHMRTSIPRADPNNKDHLCEMLLPTSKWGFEHVTTPFQNTTVGDMIRIVAQHDGTVVTAQTATMQSRYDIPKSGGWIEFPNINFPVRWTSNRPVMITQFMMSNQVERAAIMDPAMVIVPPVERYVQRAVFRIPELLPQADATYDDYAYYFSVVAEDSAVATLVANGYPLTSFDPGFRSRYVPGTRLCYASFRVEPATFVLESTTGKFSGVMYGVGPADSYANIYGMSLDTLVEVENTPPAYALQVDCGDVDGTIKDVGTTGRYLGEVTVVKARTFNYDHTITWPVDSLGTAEVTARVRDRLQDARLVIHGWDTLGNGKEWEYFYDAPNVETRSAVIDVTSVPACSTVVIRNRDTTAVTITNVRLVGDARYRLSKAVKNAVIRPGDSLRVEVCLDPPYYPPAPPADVHVDMPCDFTTVTQVRPLSGASIATVDLDLGDVRIGDTACGYARIVNDGIDPIIVDSLLFEQMAVFGVDTTGLALPRFLMPGDTIRVRVCFTPERAERSLRTDTVYASPSLRAVVRYRGRGVRPEVNDVVIDWQTRRVGTRHDSLFVLANVGNAPCVMNAVTSPMPAFDTQEATMAPIALPSMASDTLKVAFTPLARGRVSQTIGYVVDWRYHDTVTVVLRGIGTMPDVTTMDIDMGSLRIDASKDSLADVAMSTGDERLTIDTMWLTGPDVASFTVDPAIMDVRTMDIDAVLSGLIRFAPRRVGVHQAQIVMIHDGAPAFERRTSVINLTGEGLALDTFDVSTDMVVDAVVPACATRTITVSIRNTGNVPCSVSGLLVMVDELDTLPVTLQLPVTLLPAEVVSVDVAFPTGPAGTRSIRCEVLSCDSIRRTMSQTLRVVPHATTLVSTKDIMTSPGATVAVSSTLRVEGPEEPVTPSIRYDVGFDRLYVDGTEVAATVDAGPQTLTFDVVQGRDAITLSPRTQLIPPYTLTWNLSAIALWKDPLPFEVRTAVLTTNCTDSSASQTMISVDNCAAAYRMVRLGLPQIISAELRPLPVRDNISVILETSSDMMVSTDVVDLSGAVIVRWEKIDLKKGHSVCNFNCSTVAGGVYWLRIGQGTEHISLPLVIVN